eukprot:m51a1_g3152 hypothetical protein (643) ;mRNA; f:333393-335459
MNTRAMSRTHAILLLLALFALARAQESSSEGASGESEQRSVVIGSGSATSSSSSSSVPEADLEEWCETATPVVVGELYEGTTDVPRLFDFSCAGHDVRVHNAGVWYSFVGTGSAVSAHTCGGPRDGVDTVVAVFASCNSSCLFFNDNGCGLMSRVTFETVAGVVYHVFVSGNGSSRGSFGLMIDTVDEPANLSDTNSSDGSGIESASESQQDSAANESSDNNSSADLSSADNDSNSDNESSSNPSADNDSSSNVDNGSSSLSSADNESADNDSSSSIADNDSSSADNESADNDSSSNFDNASSSLSSADNESADNDSSSVDNDSSISSSADNESDSNSSSGVDNSSNGSSAGDNESISGSGADNDTASNSSAGNDTESDSVSSDGGEFVPTLEVSSADGLVFFLAFAAPDSIVSVGRCSFMHYGDTVYAITLGMDGLEECTGRRPAPGTTEVVPVTVYRYGWLTKLWNVELTMSDRVESVLVISPEAETKHVSVVPATTVTAFSDAAFTQPIEGLVSLRPGDRLYVQVTTSDCRYELSPRSVGISVAGWTISMKPKPKAEPAPEGLCGYRFSLRFNIPFMLPQDEPAILVVTSELASRTRSVAATRYPNAGLQILFRAESKGQSPAIVPAAVATVAAAAALF